MRNPRRSLALLRHGHPSTVAALACAAGMAVLGLAGDVHAQEGKRTSSLAWVRLEGAESCIAGSTLARSVEERLRRKVFVSAADADLGVEGSIGPVGAAKGGGFHAVLRVTGRDGKILGTREVDTRSAHCEAIDEKLSLVVSVLIDPDADSTTPEPEAAPSALPPPPTIVERDRVVVVHDAPPPPVARWRFELAVALTGSAGLQPDLGVGVAPSVLLHPPNFWSILVGGGIAASSSTELVRGASAEASLAHGLLALCPLEGERGRFAALACAGALVGALRSRGVGFDTTSSTSSLVAGPMVTGRVGLSIVGPVAAYLAADLVVPLADPELGYRTPAGESTLFRTSSVAGIGELGIGVKFP